MVDRQPTRRHPPFRARFVRDRRGAAAVEFAMIALPFLALMAGIIELGLLFMGSISLDNALHTASRRIRTGELTAPPTATSAEKEANREAFRDEVCNSMGFMAADCMAKLSIDVKTVTSFANTDLTSPIQGGTFNPGSVTFDPGTGGSLVMVTAYYRWTMFTPLMNQALERLPGETLLTSVITFRNEPFGT
jgi:Flp pilus assembly protein TadG